MKRYTSGFFLISLIIALFTIVTTPDRQPVLAQETDTTASSCKALQIVFVTDQSGSMSGFTTDEGREIPASDPDGLRFAAPQSFFELMANARWQNYADAEIAIATIDFGDDPHTAMPWVPLDTDSEASYDQLLVDTESYFAPRSSRGNTLPLRALQSTSSLFAQMETPQDGCPRRAVIILTDGLPADGQTAFNRTGYFEQMEQYVQDFMPASDHKIYVIGLDRNDSYFNDHRPQWEAIAGDPDRVKRVSSPQEVNSLMTQIAVDLLLSLDQTGGGQLFSCVDGGAPFMVPPYIQEMSFQLTKPDDTYHLVVLDPSGQDAQTLSNAKLTGYDRTIEKLTITAPEPGFWEMTTQMPEEFRGSCLLSWIAFQAVDRVIKPLEGLRLPQYTAVDVEFQIVKTDGSSLPDYQDDTYDLSMDVVLTSTEGEQILTLGADPGQVYRGRTVALYPGENEVVV
ncbi:MAG: VWA domain-containing protein, partial [Anaerolineales bacterium]|nr:VWA domain-containing protein [Anaerolineales bacterium]